MSVAAVGAAVAVLERHGGNAGCELLDFAQGRRDVVRMDKLDEGAAQELLGRPAQSALEGGVDALEVAVRPSDAEHVQRHLEELLEVMRHLFCSPDGLPVTGPPDVERGTGRSARKLALYLAQHLAGTRVEQPVGVE